jgi:hypothetical protein
MSDVDTSAITIDNLDNSGDSTPPAGQAPAASKPTTSATVTQEVTPPADASQEAPADAQPSQDDAEKFQKSSDYKRISRQRANAERRAMRAEARLAELEAREAARTPQPPPAKSAEIRRSDFASDAEYQYAVGLAEVRKVVAEEVGKTREEQTKRERAQAAESTQREFLREAAKQAETLGIQDFQDDWDTLIEIPKDQMSEAFASYVYSAENKAALVHHFAENTDEVARISQLHPAQAFRELARLDLKFGEKPKPNVTKAPAPGPTVGGRAVHHGDWRASNDMEDFAAGFMQEQERRRKME